MTPPQAENEANILVVDDEEDFRELFAEIITRLGYQVFTAADGLRALEYIRRQKIDVALVDFQMPRMNGLELLREIKKLDEEITVLFITGHGSIESAVDAMKQGAYDYVTKPIRFEEFENLLQRLIQTRNLIHENRRLKAELRRKYDLQNIIGTSQVMLEVLRQLDKASKNLFPVLLEGESGTGKKLAAKTIHFNSNRADKPFIPFDCSALSDELLLDEWAGRETNSNSPNQRYSKKGLFRLAQGGTIFLQEISALSPVIQETLLKILQTGQIIPLDSAQPFPLDIRLIVASPVSLRRLTARKSFNTDLYQHLSRIHIVLPPLRERSDDIPLLIRYFLQQSGKTSLPTIADETMRILQRYSWRKNVWELENVVQHAFIVQTAEMIMPNQLPDYILSESGTSSQSESVTVKPLAQIEKEAILQALRMRDWDIKAAARILQIPSASLLRKMKQHRLSADPSKT